MISTIKVHQPPPTPNPAMRGATVTQPLRRLENLQYLDLTDCASLEDTGLKMVVETCPQLLYLFLRRCTAISGNFFIATRFFSPKIAKKLLKKGPNSEFCQVKLEQFSGKLVQNFGKCAEN